MFVPIAYRPDQVFVDNGPLHLHYEWKCDPTLAERWPTRDFCQGKGWDQRLTIARYHLKMLLPEIGGQPSSFAVKVAPWKDPGAIVHPQKIYGKPLVVIRVRLPNWWSQYLGWLTDEDLAEIEPVNVGRNKSWPNIQRLVCRYHLKPGPPIGVRSCAT